MQLFSCLFVLLKKKKGTPKVLELYHCTALLWFLAPGDSGPCLHIGYLVWLGVLSLYPKDLYDLCMFCSVAESS